MLRTNLWLLPLALTLGLSALFGCASEIGHAPDPLRPEAREEPEPIPPQVIHTEAAPKAIGPYSQAVRAGNFVYLSGQIGVDPVDRQLVPGGVEAETRQTLENIRAVLEAAGLGLEDVVQCQVFLADIGDYAAVNAVYSSYFPEGPPARAAVQVAALPAGAQVEILSVAYDPCPQCGDGSSADR
jgi:2-iminobutanoate/2-iminopropanoate deaminase